VKSPSSAAVHDIGEAAGYTTALTGFIDAGLNATVSDTGD